MGGSNGVIKWGGVGLVWGKNGVRVVLLFVI